MSKNNCNCENGSELLEEQKNKIEWQSHHEEILVDWADKAMCYQWLHNKSRLKYSFLRNIYTIPVIIMSTLTGTANFAIERIPEEYKSYVSIGIGSINLLAGIITTVSQFLNINELSESHRVSAIAWDKFYRTIRVELVKAPEERTSVELLIKICRDEFDRLIETSPNIDAKIIKKFNTTFSSIKSDRSKNKVEINIKNELFKSLSKPEILECESINSTRNIVYKAPVQSNIDNSKLMNLIKQKKEKMENDKQIEEFIIRFKEEYSRIPTEDEIYNNLQEELNEDIIREYIEKSVMKKGNVLNSIVIEN